METELDFFCDPQKKRFLAPFENATDFGLLDTDYESDMPKLIELLELPGVDQNFLEALKVLSAMGFRLIYESGQIRMQKFLATQEKN